ncbi:glycosyltransferase family 1 protein [Arthrobacter sp. GMC3]|uniref:rhamnosyltransferase WsaF family glycosyltransferase n=1 Tax=Arthrobacter sp. GMC3 TaxID=2058894 RepID=UPI000CE31E63|nr:glycosyltransferase family 1 protein [Arthrobacter sp. GMC3]
MSIVEKIEMSRRAFRRDGAFGVAGKIAQRMSWQSEDLFGWRENSFPLLWDDICQSQAVSVGHRQVDPFQSRTTPLTIGWVCMPPKAGSGGHTTLFRMVQAAEKRGHRCVIFVYDKDTEKIDRHIHTIRTSWPDVKAEVRSARPRIDGIDVVVASSWESAHVVARRAVESIPKYYFIQDYEPFFHARGPLWELAEDTYRFGFTMIALGEMVASCLASFASVNASAIVPFGCDTAVYSNSDSENRVRNGVVFYAKKRDDRRGYWLAKQALELFHKAHPDQEIHVVGDTPTRWSVPVTAHGSVTPASLCALYNRSLAGLALSYTNVSLAPVEMLAAGAIPVINDSPMARLSLATSGPVWVPSTPQAIADGLSAVVAMDEAELAKRRSYADSLPGWGDTGDQVVDVFERGSIIQASAAGA